MKINSALNFVIPIYTDDGERIVGYVHSAPISYEAFEANFWLISKTYTAIHESGLGSTAAPKVATLVLKSVAKEMSRQAADAEAMASTLLAEIRRLSTAILPKDPANVVAGPGSGPPDAVAGWQPIPYQAAVERKLIEVEDAREVDAAILFFTVEWHMLPRGRRMDVLGGAVQIWDARITSLSPTEFVNSLATSTVDASSGATVAA
jgi:hypothetical protein